jgi:F0F1-type ATP synthase membrane subunit b/b'
MTKETSFETEEMLREASDKAEKIKLQASQTATAERRAAITQYQDQLVELAIARARSKVSGMLSAEVDTRLKNKVLGSVAGLLN